MSDLQTLVGKILSDPTFAETLIDSPETTLRGMNIDPTPEILSALNGLDVHSVKRLAAAFGDDKAA